VEGPEHKGSERRDCFKAKQVFFAARAAPSLTHLSMLACVDASSKAARRGFLQWRSPIC
jgi:hypothetical protein